METMLVFELKEPAYPNIGNEPGKCHFSVKSDWFEGQAGPSVPGISQFLDHTSHCLMYLVRCLHSRVYSSRHRVCPFCGEQASLLRLTQVRFDLSVFHLLVTP